MKLINHSVKFISAKYSRLLLYSLAGLCILLAILSRREAHPAVTPSDTSVREDHPAVLSTPLTGVRETSTFGEDHAAASSTLPVSAVPEKRADSPSHAEISRLLEHARHRVIPITGAATGLDINRGATHFMQNPGLSLTARFAEGGMRLGSSKGESWQVDLRYSAASPASTQQADASRMTIRHPDGVVEWYENSAKGIEHGFTLATRTTDTGSREIALTMEGMTARQDGENLIWALPNGADALAYRSLQVNDATGATLPAEMRAIPGGLIISFQDATAVYPVRIDPTITRATAKLSPINLGDGQSGDYFGNAIATDGQTLVVAAVNDNSDEGSVYIFTRVSGEWIFKQKLYPTGTASHKKYGTSVSMHNGVIVVGAPGDGFYGSAYIYENLSGDWALSAKVANVFDGMSMGSSVSVENGTVLVGADGYTGGSPSVIGKGYVFVYEKVSGVWTLQVRLEDPSGTTNDEFGSAVLIKSGYAYIGKPGKNAGEVMIYKKSGSTWTYLTRLYGVTTGDRFGDALATDGSALAIGAPYDDTTAGTDAGSVQVFRKSADTWASEGILTASDAVSYDYFGTSAAIQGSRLLIGSPRGYSSYGCAYIFEKTTTWTQKTRLVPYNTSYDGRSGYTVAMVDDAVWVGAYHSNTYANDYAGIINEYRLKSSTWENTDLITSGDSGFYLNFGSELDIDGQRIAVGVPTDTSPYGDRIGSAYVFVKANGEWQIEAFFMDDTPGVSEGFGGSVDIEGDCLMVGTPDDVDTSRNVPPDISSYRFGSVTCFRRGVNGWVKEAKMRPTVFSGSSSDKFGASIAMRGDSVLIGSPLYTTATPSPGGTIYNTPGAAFLFKKIGGTWTQQARLMVAGSSNDWRVGGKVALGDGRIFLTATGHLNSSYHYGRVVEFTGSGTSWVEGGSLYPSTWIGNETFGSSISLDGDVLLVGSAYGNHARVFRRSDAVWQEEAVLVSPDAADGKTHSMGSAVALKGDLALVSDISDYVLGQVYAGSIHVFRKQNGTWIRTQKLTAPDASDGAALGAPIATDGTQVLTAATGETTRNPLTGDLTDYRGSVYLFELGEGYRTLEVIQQNQFTNELTYLSRTGSNVTFPWTVVGSSNLPEKIILRNNGSAPVSGISLSLQGTDAAQFNYQHPFVTSIPTSIAPGAEVVVYLYFAPTLSGVNKSATLLVTNDDGAGDYQIGISGLANTKPQKTGGTYTCYSGQAFTIFAKDLAMDTDGHSFVINDSTTTLTGGKLVASGNKLTFTANVGFTGDIIFWYNATDQYGAYSQIVNTMKVVAAPGSGGDAGGPSATRPIQRLDANTLGILLKGESGVTYQIQRSCDLLTWETLGSAVPVSSGDLLFMDYQNDKPNAFYRLLK